MVTGARLSSGFTTIFARFTLEIAERAPFVYCPVAMDVDVRKKPRTAGTALELPCRFTLSYIVNVVFERENAIELCWRR